ncbi:MAG: SufE family protein [Alphaproteobacteria bacterium]|nr:SufE family protein [Alphaproteobacteria bacterium]
MTVDELKENFSYLTDWESRYAYLIELGESLPVFSEEDKIPENKVEGCMSQVWLTARRENDVFYFNATSDAVIVKGLIAVVLSAYSGKTSDEIKRVDIQGLFDDLDLGTHLSPTRRNGFFAMVERIKNISA